MNLIKFMILIIILNLSGQENRVQTPDPLTLGPDAGPKRIGSGRGRITYGSRPQSLGSGKAAKPKLFGSAPLPHPRNLG